MAKQFVQLFRLVELAGYQVEFSLKKKKAALGLSELAIYPGTTPLTRRSVRTDLVKHP